MAIVSQLFAERNNQKAPNIIQITTGDETRNRIEREVATLFSSVANGREGDQEAYAALFAGAPQVLNCADMLVTYLEHIASIQDYNQEHFGLIRKGEPERKDLIVFANPKALTELVTQLAHAVRDSKTFTEIIIE